MSHVTPFSKSAESLEDGESTENPFNKVPEYRTSVDNILRVNHGNQMRLGLMADQKANIMITVASIVFSITIANVRSGHFTNSLSRFAIATENTTDATVIMIFAFASAIKFNLI